MLIPIVMLAVFLSFPKVEVKEEQIASQQYDQFGDQIITCKPFGNNAQMMICK